MYSPGLVVLAAAVLVTIAIAGWFVFKNGRFTAPEASGTPDPDVAPSDRVPVLTEVDIGAPLGERVTLLQFSTSFCAPCRATRVVLDHVAAQFDGVVHVEVDAEANLDLVRRTNVLRTPTTLVLDGQGRTLSRASGAVKADQVRSLLVAVGSSPQPARITDQRPTT